MLQNLLIGRHRHRATNLFEELLFLPSVRRAEIAQREAVERVIDLLDLAHYRDSLVAGLPYGVRKVIELGRALATEPKLMLLDEPSSGLNPDETDDMAFWIEDIQKELGITVLMVEHDMNLVSRVSDRVLALNEGRVIAEGTPARCSRIRRWSRRISGEGSDGLPHSARSPPRAGAPPPAGRVGEGGRSAPSPTRPPP